MRWSGRSARRALRWPHRGSVRRAGTAFRFRTFDPACGDSSPSPGVHPPPRLLLLLWGRLGARGRAAVLGGGDAHLVVEEAGEIALRREAELGGELRDLAAPGGQARDRGLDAQQIEIGAGREPGADLEQIVEPRA